MDEQRKNVEERDQDTQMASVHLQERREARYEVPIEIEISGLTRDGQVFHERTFTRDVSEWGCGFTASAELKVDDIIAVSVISPGAEESATRPTSLFQVVRVTPEADGWLVGAWKMNREKLWGPYLEKLGVHGATGRGDSGARRPVGTRQGAMSSRNLTVSAASPGEDRARADKTQAGGPAGVEIVNFPQILYTRTFGDPDMLFVPLLDAAREAYGMVERLSSHGENRANAVMLSGMHLASSLLRDSSFSLVARGISHEHSYIVDLTAGTLRVSTRLYASVSRRTSLFKVEMAGNIAAGPFVVRNPLQGTVLMQVEEEKLRQPNFFATEMAQECLRAQIEKERAGLIEETMGPANGEVRLIITVAGNKIPVTLRQKEQSGTWDIIDGRMQEWVGTLAPDMEVQLKNVTKSLQDLFVQK